MSDCVLIMSTPRCLSMRTAARASSAVATLIAAAYRVVGPSIIGPDTSMRGPIN